MRNTFINTLVKLANERSNVALIVGDLGYSVVEPFADQFPDRFINAGVAEQNMTGLAAGMASEGFHVFTYSIANFPTFRCAEQIRNDIDYHKLPVTVVSVGGGLSYGALGYSHHAIQDYALLRTFPNMLIAAPGDPLEVEACMNYLADNPQPSYLRLGKTGEKNFHLEPPQLEPGRWVPINTREGAKKIVLTTGAALQSMANFKGDESLNEYSLFSMPLWGMSCKNLQAGQVKGWSEILTIEDHLQDGGFSSWLSESISQDKKQISKITTRSLNAGVCGQVGSQQILEKLGGII